MALSASDSPKGDTGEVSPEFDVPADVDVMEQLHRKHTYQDEPPVWTTEAVNSKKEVQQTVNTSRLCLKAVAECEMLFFCFGDSVHSHTMFSGQKRLKIHQRGRIQSPRPGSGLHQRGCG